MFDQYRIGGGTSYHHSNSTITEKRAPTDESVALLRDMEAKAMENIIHRIHADNNSLSCEWVIFRDNFSYRNKAICKYQINGENFVFEGDISDHKPKDEAIKELMEDFSSHLRRHFVPSFVKTFSGFLK